MNMAKNMRDASAPLMALLNTIQSALPNDHNRFDLLPPPRMRQQSPTTIASRSDSDSDSDVIHVRPRSSQPASSRPSSNKRSAPSSSNQRARCRRTAISDSVPASTRSDPVNSGDGDGRSAKRQKQCADRNRRYIARQDKRAQDVFRLKKKSGLPDGDGGGELAQERVNTSSSYITNNKQERGEEQEEDECHLCLEPMSTYQCSSFDGCGHLIHTKCMAILRRDPRLQPGEKVKCLRWYVMPFPSTLCKSAEKLTTPRSQPTPKL